MKLVNKYYYKVLSLVRKFEMKKFSSVKKYSDTLSEYANKEIMTSNEINEYIIDKIDSGKPFCAGRFGSTELLNMQSYEFGGYIGQKYDKNFHFNHLCEWSGFFPKNIELLHEFVNVMKNSCKELDVLAVWFHAFEDYYIKKNMQDHLKISYLLDFEPWSGDVHWSSALKGKKVLVIHPFENTIKSQYEKRELIFLNTDILPEFELKTLRAVQTLAGTKDDRFETWFDALDWMYKQAMQIDFDIAIIGCGAYGLPLSVKIKNSGKQAIHLAGATQLLFGIKGKRWEENKSFQYVSKYFNDNWVYPSDSDKLENQNIVEGGCYWK
ncbi:MAG: hypothetical protein R3Y35_09830 [Clostridia bacterium]